MKRLFGSCAALISLLLGAALVPGGCTQPGEPVPVRALERSGRAAFVCLSAPGTQPGPGRPLSDCPRKISETIHDFKIDADGESTLPHLYALVTQTTRGEVAVIDLTTNKDPIIDQDMRVPGSSFLHIAAQPIDIVATEGGTAAFVSVAEIGRAGIFALPSTMLRPGPINRDKPEAGTRPVPTLSSWPACALPAAPGDMRLMSDPPVGGAVRLSCDGAYGEADPVPEHPHGDLNLEEGQGRQKIVVTLPDMGGIAVLDAQRLLDRPAGDFRACDIERWFPLEVQLSAPVIARPYPSDGACVNPAPPEPSAKPLVTPRPAGMSSAGGRLYVADLDAPVVHVIDMPTPCEPVELPPLLPSSLSNPDRVVTTSRVAVAPELTPDFRRYLYAVDADEGTTMVFDVSEGADTSRRPLQRHDPQWNPFQVADRIQFVAPVEDLVIVSRDTPIALPTTGVASEGTRCSPDPVLQVCSSTSTSCDPETLYRTSNDLKTGAGPTRLRGMFAFLLLSTGQISIIDIDDYDGLCRGPLQYQRLLGCPPAWVPAADLPRTDKFVLPKADPDDADVPTISREVSCNIVQPHAARSRSYFMSSDVAGRNEPGLQLFPLLYNKDGTPIVIEDENSMMMRATIPAATRCHRDSDCHASEKCIDPGDGVTICGTACTADADCLPPETCCLSDTGCTGVPAVNGLCSGPNGVALSVANQILPIDVATGLVEDDERRHTMVMNLEDPRVHVLDQAWVAVYEGTIPSFSGKVTQFCYGNSSGSGGGSPSDGVCPELSGDTAILQSPDGRFCSGGIQSEASVYAQLVAQGSTAAEAAQLAPDLADFAQITTELLDKDQDYWNNAAPQCSYEECRATFGLASAVTLRSERELRIKEAYQEKIEVESRAGVSLVLTKCCFPALLSFDVRAGNQWIVLGQGSGFIHHVIEDPETGVCRNSCDPAASRRNARIRMTAPRQVVSDGDARAFINPMFRFSISAGDKACVTDDDCPDTPCTQGRCVLPPQKDMLFRWTTQGSFRPLNINLSNTAALQPQSIFYVKSTDEFAVTDGSIEGLIMVSAGGLSVSRHYF